MSYSLDGSSPARLRVLVPAPLGRRLAARLIDIAFATALSFVLVIPVCLVLLPLALALNAAGNQELWGAIGGGTCLVLAFVCMEWLLLVRRQGQTLGKGLMGLRVVRQAPDGAVALASVPALLRLIGLGLLTFTPIGAFGFLANVLCSVADRPRRRMLHDFPARSRVVRAPKREVALAADLRMALPVPQASLVKASPAAPEAPVTLKKGLR
jgi:uncharacterized RDD family membrane protein YckC